MIIYFIIAAAAVIVIIIAITGLVAAVGMIVAAIVAEFLKAGGLGHAFLKERANCSFKLILGRLLVIKSF
jgi:hypothetical protein